SSRRREDVDNGGSSDAQPQQPEDHAQQPDVHAQQRAIRSGNPMQGVVLHKPSPNEATSSGNIGIKCPNDFAPVTGSVAAAEADMETLHVPIFKAVQDILNTKTAGVSADMDTLHMPNFKAVQDILNTKTAGVESQHTPTVSDTVIDVMPTTSFNHSDQPKRNFGESTGGSKESAIFDKYGMETAPSDDVTPPT
ncbi:hypothetical protein FCV25MIE_00990, partial [Fagus crenata]